jgi:hypothetical protein
MDKPNDKPQEKDAFEDPKLYVVIGKEKFPKQGLDTVFADISDISENGDKTDDDDHKKQTGGVVCSCHKVRVKQKVRERPECSHSSSSRSGGGGCKCAPVH